MDDELLGIAKSSIGAQVGLSEAPSARLKGEAADELRKDAKAMAMHGESAYALGV